jgi:hypothetical protein
MKYLIALLSLVVAVTSSTGPSDADLDRKTKATACIYLAKAAVFHNQEYFPKIADSFLYSDTEDLVRQWSNKVLLNCFNTISLIKSADIISRKKPENISPFAKDNKEVLNIKKYHEKYEKDSAKLLADSDRLKKVLGDLQSELIVLDEAIRKLAKGFVGKIKREQMDENRKQKEEEKQESGNQNGRLNISLITKMDNTVKYSLVGGMVAIFGFGFYFALKALSKNTKLEGGKKKNK